jgi:hypothetical protein
MRHILSYFSAPITNKKPSGEVDLCEIHKYITTNEQLREATATVRAAYEATNMEQYKRGKLTMLPSVTPAGVFREAKTSALVYPTGLLVVDYDGLESHQAAMELRDKLFADNLLKARLAFVSPSGRGVKLFLPYDLAIYTPFERQYREYLERAWFYIEAFYGVEADRSGKDISRLCLLCHDADAKFRDCDEMVKKK